MQRNYNSEQYVATVRKNEKFFRKYFYHSVVDLNLVKLDSILKHGVLSRGEIERLGLISSYLHPLNSFDCKNGNDFISLVDYDKLFRPIQFANGDIKDKPSFNMLFEAFALHTLTSVSVLIDRDIVVSNKGELESLFDDEVFAYKRIEVPHIQGILLPEHLTNGLVRETPFLPGDEYCYSERNIVHLLDDLEKYFGASADRELMMKSLKQAKDFLPEVHTITRAIRKQKEIFGTDMKDTLSSIISDLWSEETGIDDPKYIDIIRYINRSKLPIYEIDKKKLKKI